MGVHCAQRKCATSATLPRAAPTHAPAMNKCGAHHLYTKALSASKLLHQPPFLVHAHILAHGRRAGARRMGLGLTHSVRNTARTHSAHAVRKGV